MQESSFPTLPPIASRRPQLFARLVPQSIAAQLTLLTALGLAVALILGGATFLTLLRLDAATQQVIVLYDEARLIDSIYTANLQIAQELDAVLAGDNDTLVPFILAQNEDLLADFSTYRSVAEQQNLTSDIAFVTENEPLVMQLRQDVYTALNRYREDELAGAQALVAQINRNIVHLASAVERTAGQRQLALIAQTERRNALQQQQIWMMVAIFLIGSLLLVGISVGVTRSIVVSLARLTTSASLIAGGNYGHRIALGTGGEIARLGSSFNHMAASVQERQEQVQQQQETIAQRAVELERTLEALPQTVGERDELTSAIREMANPVLPVAPGTLVMPLIGAIDSERAAQLNSSLLGAVERHRARITILDVTGLPLIDTQVARALLDTTYAARLLGSTIILVGMRPELAQTIVGLGIELPYIITLADLQSGIRYALTQVA